MVALVRNYKGVRRPVPALGANSVYSVFREPAVAWVGLACCSVRVCGAPQGGYLLVPWALLTAALWRAVFATIA